MILSVSRRTDIPAFYSDWFFNRIKEGYLYVRNPMYKEKVSKIILNPDVIDCIVFWTKNAAPMLPYLEKLKDYQYYFQYTINGYGTDVEPVMGGKLEESINAFICLSEKIGAERVIWRYDPILFSKTYTPEFHLKQFEFIAEKLYLHTNRCIISFVDLYGHSKTELLNTYELEEESLKEFAEKLVEIAKKYNMVIETCAEKIDLEKEGINHTHCIDKELIEKIIGYSISGTKDKSQRPECGCMESIDIGTYNTCKHFCKYCYANFNNKLVENNNKLYDVFSPFLCDSLNGTEVITERKMKSLKRKIK